MHFINSSFSRSPESNSDLDNITKQFLGSVNPPCEKKKDTKIRRSAVLSHSRDFSVRTADLVVPESENTRKNAFT